MTTPAAIIGTAVNRLQPIGTSLINTRTILSEIRDQLPRRGPLTDLYIELAEALAMIEYAYHQADEALLNAYQKLEHAERAQREGWTPQPLNGTP